MKADELCLNSMDAGHPDIYISGDDDAESPDLRISFAHGYSMVWYDMPPHRLAALRDLIDEALRGVGHWTPPDQSEVEAEQQRTDLAMLVGRLIQQVRKNDPKNKTAEQARLYLARKGLLPSIIDR